MFRKERVTEMLQACLLKNLSTMRDPRLSNVAINEIDLSPDLRHAKLYWAFLLEDSSSNDKSKKEEEKKNTQKALDGSVGFLRKKIAEELDLKYVPELYFKYDLAAETGARIDQLLDQIKTKDSTQDVESEESE